MPDFGSWATAWWKPILFVIVAGHLTNVSVTLFLHRAQTHRGVKLHFLAALPMRLWLWLSTAIVTKEWVACHRKHHAFADREGDPHSPLMEGLRNIILKGAFYYRKTVRSPGVLDKYGKGTPNDWLERHLLSPLNWVGILVMLAVDVYLFGFFVGAAVWGVQMIWIPFWAAGIINGVGHAVGYRNFNVKDESRNISPIAIWLGGEELHNNHHAYVTSAKLSNKWYELDIGWLYIRVLAALGLAQVKKIAPTPKFAEAKPAVDLETLQAVIMHRYDVLARYAKSLRATYTEEMKKLRRLAPQDAHMLQGLKRWLHRDEKTLLETERLKLAEILKKSTALDTVYSMRAELAALWERSSASGEQLVRQLQDWCRRAEASGIRPLVEFSLRLRRYALPT